VRKKGTGTGFFGKAARQQFRKPLWPKTQHGRYMWLMENFAFPKNTQEEIRRHLAEDGRVQLKHFFFDFTNGFNETPSTSHVKRATPEINVGDRLPNGELSLVRRHAKPERAIPVKLIEVYNEFRKVTLGSRKTTAYALFVKGNTKLVREVFEKEYPREWSSKEAVGRHFAASSMVISELYSKLNQNEQSMLEKGGEVVLSRDRIRECITKEAVQRLSSGPQGKYLGLRNSGTKVISTVTGFAKVQGNYADRACVNLAMAVLEHCTVPASVTQDSLVVAIRHVLSRRIFQKLSPNFLSMLNAELGMEGVERQGRTRNGTPKVLVEYPNGVALKADRTSQDQAKLRQFVVETSKETAAVSLVSRLLREISWAGTDEALIRAAALVVAENAKLPKVMNNDIREAFARHAGFSYNSLRLERELVSMYKQYHGLGKHSEFAKMNMSKEDYQSRVERSKPLPRGPSLKHYVHQFVMGYKGDIEALLDRNEQGHRTPQQTNELHRLCDDILDLVVKGNENERMARRNYVNHMKNISIVKKGDAGKKREDEFVNGFLN
jgi:hypothetical protein